MPLKRRKRLEGDFEIRAFADIVFLLLIFFVLTTTFVRPQGRRLRVPSGVEDPSAKIGKQPTVHLSAEVIRWGESRRDLTLEELRERLAERNFEALPDDQRAVILNAGDDVRFQRYYEVVMAIHKAGGVLALVEADQGGGD